MYIASGPDVEKYVAYDRMRVYLLLNSADVVVFIPSLTESPGESRGIEARVGLRDVVCFERVVAYREFPPSEQLTHEGFALSIISIHSGDYFLGQQYSCIDRH